MRRFLLIFLLSSSLVIALSGQTASKGNLFSAILFAGTPLGQRWAALRPEAEKLFPNLKMKAVADLHVTIIYIGKDWQVEKLPELRKAMTVTIPGTIRLSPEVAIIGRNRHVAVVDLKGSPEALQTQIFTVKAALNQAGLKKPEAYDASFRPHVTLAEATSNPPSEQQALELKAFQAWIAPRLDLPSLSVVLEPSMPIQLLLADAPRPEPLPEYIPVEKFLETLRQKSE